MKQLIFAMSLMALTSCKDNKQQGISNQNEKVEKHSESTHDQHQNNSTTVYDNTWMTKMQLNNGGKWQANVETNEGVKRMQKILTTQITSKIEDYHKLAEQLNEAKNYVVKKCTMTGASHDNLHVWLLPLIEKIDALSKTETINEAEIIKHSIEENLDAYNNYFQ
tara:strand:+ start:2358 stop:2852 length:495 start_codon:yes stop_codon:yes gene_type:complete